MNVHLYSALIRAVFGVFTVYMLLILLRWLGGWLELDLYAGRLGWIPKLTDPLIERIRKVLPSMGPMDFSPIAAVLLIWLVREMVVLVMFTPLLQKFTQ